MIAPRSIANAFVGRTYELDLIRHIIEETASGTGRIVTLSGEPGIGKTTLAKQVAAIAKDQGLYVLEARCFEQEGTPTYWPWIKLIRRYVESEHGRLEERLGSRAELIERLVEPGGGVSGRDAESAVSKKAEPLQHRFRLFDAISALFNSLSAWYS